MVDFKKLSRNIQLSKCAAEMKTDITNLINAVVEDTEGREYVINKVALLLLEVDSLEDEKCPSCRELATPMSEEEFRKFEKKKMPPGQYKGVGVGSVPVSYIEFIADSLPFVKQCVRYLKSPHLKD